MKIVRTLIAMYKQSSLEKRIYYVAQLLCLCAVFFSWSSITNESVVYLSGFESIVGLNAYTICILLVFHFFVIGYPHFKQKEVLSKQVKALLPLTISASNFLLTFSALGTLTKASWRFSELDVQNGVYLTLLFSLIALTYSVLVYRSAPESTPASPIHSEPETQVNVPNAPEAETHSVLRNLPK